MAGKSSRDLIDSLREDEIREAKDYTEDKVQVTREKGLAKEDDHDEALPNIKDYSLFSEGKRPLVATTLNLPGLQVQRFYLEYWKLKRMYKLATLFQENEDGIGYLFNWVD
jgi:hypothetical protein